MVERHTTLTIGLLPVREAFRAWRYRFRQNGRLLRRVTKKLRKNAPFSETAGKVFEGLEGVVKDVDKFASDVGRNLLQGSSPEILATAPSLQTSDNEKLAKVAYSALNSIVSYLGHKEAYVSESSAMKALAKVSDRTDLRQSETAAALMLSLLDEKVLWFPTPSFSEKPSEILDEAIPVFALLLWLQSDCDDPYGGEALSTAADISKVLGPDIVSFASTKDQSKITLLFEEFSPHV